MTLIFRNVLSGTGASLVIFILSIPDLGLVDVSRTLTWIFLFLPNFDLGQALGDMYINFVVKTACEVRYTAAPIYLRIHFDHNAVFSYVIVSHSFFEISKL